MRRSSTRASSRTSALDGRDVASLVAGKPNILVVCPPHIGDRMLEHPIRGNMGDHCPEKSREISRHLRPLAEELGCVFLDAEGIAETNRVDYIHLSRKGHRQLAEALAERVPALLASH